MKTKFIKGFKGFDRNLKCRGFQYEIGKEYKYKGDVSVCNAGFHFCEYPLDVLAYYNLAESRFAEVTANDGKREKKEIRKSFMKLKKYERRNTKRTMQSIYTRKRALCFF